MTLVVINKEMALQMTLRNTLRFDPEKSSIYKRAAQTFDLFWRRRWLKPD
jgi:hypothetical protein